MNIHPKARPIFPKLVLPGPLQKHFSPVDCEIDLTNSTNPYIDELAHYPDLGQDKLKQLYLNIILSLNTPIDFTQALASHLTPKNILFTVGSIEGIDLVVRSFGEPNKDTLCVLSPSFPAYEHWGTIHNLIVKKIPLSGENLDKFDVEEVIRLNPQLVFLCSPNNPTGTLLSPADVERLCQSLEGLVVIDEAYIEFAQQPSFVYALSRYKNLIVLRTLSKAWGLAAVRCGAIIADESIINTLRYIQVPFGFATPSQKKVEERCLHPQSMLASWEKIKAERETLIATLSQARSIKKIFRSQSNFILYVLNDFPAVMRALAMNKIHVADFSAVLPQSIKVSIGSEQENKKFLQIIENL